MLGQRLCLSPIADGRRTCSNCYINTVEEGVGRVPTGVQDLQGNLAALSMHSASDNAVMLDLVLKT